MNTSALIPFDYGVVSSDTAVSLQAQAKRIKQRIQKTTEDIIEIGRDLLAAKEHLDHGQFRTWVEREVGINPRSAQRYMGAARLCEKNDTVTLLPPGVVYCLAAPSTPPEIIEIVTAKVTSGEIVSEITVKEMKEDAKRKAREEEQANKRKARRSRLSKNKRQELERCEQVAREAEERRREDLAHAIDAWVEKFSIDGANGICALMEEFDCFAVEDALKDKIKNLSPAPGPYPASGMADAGTAVLPGGER